MKLTTIELRKNHENFTSGREFKKTFDLDYLADIVEQEIDYAIAEFKENASSDETHNENITSLKKLNAGDYSLDVGNFTYHITIEEERKSEFFLEHTNVYGSGEEAQITELLKQIAEYFPDLLWDYQEKRTNGFINTLTLYRENSNHKYVADITYWIDSDGKMRADLTV